MNQKQRLLHPYPFERLRNLKQGTTTKSQQQHIALSVGEPQHAPPSFVQDILNNGLSLLNKYPLTSGSDKLRTTLANWVNKRYQSNISVNHVLPVNGSREALFALAQSVIDSEAKDKPVVLMPNPFYQIYEGAALMAGAEAYYYNTNSHKDFEPDWASIPEAIWQRTQLVYTCSPGNPTGKVLSTACLKKLLSLSDEYNFIIASDECYSEIYPNDSEPPLGLLTICEQLQRSDYKNCIIFNSLSKRSNLPGLRSGLVAGEQKIIQQFLQYRTYHGSAMSLLAQEISIEAWNDESHVIENRIAYDKKYAAVLDILQQAHPLRRPDAAFFLWYPVPEAYTDESFALQLYEHANITVLPGSYLSRNSNNEQTNPGSKYVRIALVAEQQTCIEAAQRIQEFITNKPY